MRAILKFQSAQEFQIFFSQLISCEIPDFMPVDGSSGDSGFDGIDNETAYQVYFPEQHNRTNKKYIAKIDKDLKKVLKNKLGLKIKKWVFVVPEDLRMPVIAHLIKKSKEAGVKLTYIGANTLTQLASKYPHIIDSFPLIFMPSVKEDIKEVKSLVKQKGKMVSLDGVEVIGDEEFSRAIEQIRKKYQPGIDMIPKRPDGSLYRPNARDLEHIAEMQSLQEELGSKKRRSDQAFELELEEIRQFYDEQIENAEEDFVRRGLAHSGLKERAIGQLKIRKNRAIEKLKLKYGITESNLSNPVYER